MSNNTINLLNELKNLLSPYCSKEQEEAFIQHAQDVPVSSCILNTYRINDQLNLQGLTPDKDDKLLFRFDKTKEKLGKSIDHFSGAYYILDPASATISYYLSPLMKDNFLSLDLCGAPGGKTIALSMRRHDGLYLCNDLSYNRALEITKNSDRLGIDRILSLSIDPQKLNLPPMFDLIILDVPCSGSGMFRKEKKMLEDWSKEKVERLLPIQETLFEKAYSLLKKDGIIAYSTCSLSFEEDEGQVKKFLNKHSDTELISVDVRKDIVEGKNHIGYHMIPGIFDGEGIYFALIKKKEGLFYQPQEIKYKDSYHFSNRHIFSYRKNEYVLPYMYKELTNLPYISPGIKIYDDSEHPKCQFDHAFSKIVEDYPLVELNEENAKSYAFGNEISLESTLKDGLVVLSYGGNRLGFGKKVKNRIKNYLPKGLRENCL